MAWRMIRQNIILGLDHTWTAQATGFRFRVLAASAMEQDVRAV
jgi:hypothetical protein